MKMTCSALVGRIVFRKSVKYETSTKRQKIRVLSYQIKTIVFGLAGGEDVVPMVGQNACADGRAVARQIGWVSG